MGYEVYITKKENWFDEDGPAISIDEWTKFVASDPEMRLDGYAEAAVGEGKVLRIEGDGLSVWTAYSGHEKDGNMAWFYYWDGNVSVKNPDLEILQKMASIAKNLSAKVQGEEGEWYDASGIIIEQPATTASSAPIGKPWWKFWGKP